MEALLSNGGIAMTRHSCPPHLPFYSSAMGRFEGLPAIFAAFAVSLNTSPGQCY